MKTLIRITRLILDPLGLGFTGGFLLGSEGGMVAGLLGDLIGRPERPIVVPARPRVR